MSPEKRKYLLKRFGESRVYPILVEILDERIALKNGGRMTGDVFKDIPEVYKREGAVDELRWIKSLIEEFKKEYETMPESLDDDQAEAR